MIKYLLIFGFCLLAFAPDQSFVSVTILPKTQYKGYGSKTIAILNTFDISDIQKAIILAEHGGTIPVNNNVGNLRYSNGFASYPTLKEGVEKQKKILEDKYSHCFTNNPLTTIQAIQNEGYCSDKEWPIRVYAWYCVLQGDNSKLNTL